MAWETLAVVAGEIKSPSEARQNQLGHDWYYGLRNSTDDKHTGNYAAYTVGPGDGLGVQLPSWTTLRVGYWFKTTGWFAPAQFTFIAAYDQEDSNSHKVYYVIVDNDLYKILLTEYDITTDTYTTIDSTNNITPLYGNINDWKHIGFYHNSSTNSLKFWVNGELLLSGSLSVDTPKYIYVASHGWLANSGGYVYVDDLYFDYSTSSEVDDTPPARRYYPALPNGAGTYTQWTPDSGSNYDRVNDSSDPDDDTSYVAINTNSRVDTYQFASLVNVAPEASPDSAVVQAYVRNSPVEYSISFLKFRTRLGGLELSTSGKRVEPQKKNSIPEYRDWTVLSGYFDTKPTGGEWTETDFNNAEFGIESDGII